jgi:hypothetical protein
VALGHGRSGRTAIVADEGDSVWLYLTEPKGTAIAADCWLFNRIVAPSAAALRPRLPEYRARALPPPAPTEMIGPNALHETALMPGEVEVSWSADGHAVAAWVDGTLVGFHWARQASRLQPAPAGRRPMGCAARRGIVPAVVPTRAG